MQRYSEVDVGAPAFDTALMEPSNGVYTVHDLKAVSNFLSKTSVDVTIY
jgi:hypothetical protein